MKIALAQLNYHIGNFEENTSKIIESIKRGMHEGTDIVVFPELAISGYPPRDFLEFSNFVQQCITSVNAIAKYCINVAAIVGLPTYNKNDKGKPLFNSAAFLADGKIRQIVNKTLLPNYDIFDEYRYFEPNTIFNVVEYHGKKIAITICEDLWNIQDNPLYTINPMDELMKQSPDLMINIAASPYNYHQVKERKEVLRKNALQYKLPLFYVNHVGAQTELLFDGGSLVMNSDGRIVDELNYFKEDFKTFSLDNMMMDRFPNYSETPRVEIADIHDALVMGIRNYFQKLGFSKAILGLSGGLDSALTAALAVKALGSKNVYNVLLPSRYSSDHSLNDSIKLAKNLNMSYDVINIEDAFVSFENLLQPYFKGLPAGIAEENIQARTRGVILMALSNKFGYILLNTSNKSEAAVGYGTLYGDMNGGLSVIGDVYKTQAYKLARYINRDNEIIPENILSKPPSAELHPDQRDSDSLPDYDILDEILYLYIEQRNGPQEIADRGFDKDLVNRILKLVNTNEYKRYQTPPMLRISVKAFGMGRRMPIVAKYLT